MHLYISVLIVLECRNWNNIYFKFARYVVTYSDKDLAQVPYISGLFTATLLPTFMIYLSFSFRVPRLVIVI